MDQFGYIMIALFFLGLALSAVFFLSWHAIDRQKHALTWTFCLGLAALQWLDNVAFKSGLISYDVFWPTTNLLGPAAQTLALLGFRQRAKRQISWATISGLVLVPFSIAMWTTYIYPHFGISAATPSLYGVFVSALTIHTIYSNGDRKSKIEWAIIFSYFLLALILMALGFIAISNGNERVDEIAGLYNRVLLLSMPFLFTLIGLLALLLITSDLATEVRRLADNQKRQHKQEAELSRDILQDAIEAMPDLVVIADQHENLVNCNEPFAEFLGVSSQELLTKTKSEVIRSFQKLFLSINDEAVTSHQSVEEKLDLALQTGQRLNVVTLDLRVFILGIGYLRSGGTILVARDVTQLNIARTRLETAIHTMPIGFAYFEKDRVIAFNESYERLIQKDREWIEKQPFEALIWAVLDRLAYERSKEELELGYQSVVKAIQNRHYFSRIVRFDNGAWYDIRIHPVHDKGFITIATDITKRRLLEIGIEENEAQLRVILGNQPFPVVVLSSANSEAIFASKAALEVLGESSHDKKEAEGSVLIQSSDTIRFLKDSISMLADKEISEVTLQRSTGVEFPALLSAQDIQFSGGPAQVVSFIDISNIKNLQTELESQREALFQSEKLNALGNLLAGVAHELNNPLTIIVANAHVLSKTSVDDKTSSRLKSISDAAERCSKIIRSFLDMARKDAGELSEFNVADCIRQAIEVSNVGLKIHEISINADIQPDLPTIMGNQDQFTQVVLNLIINAQQVLSEINLPRTITITAKLNSEGNLVIIDVIDNGPGVSDELQDRIFEPYFTTKGVGEGTGMGLSIAKGILKSHSGTLHLIHSPGNGAHFQILMPHTNTVLVEDDTQKQNRRKTQPSQRRVLIVDDEEEVVSALGEVISLEGHQVETVDSAVAALSILEHNYFDLILSDIRMPEMDGAEFYEQLKNTYPLMATKIAFITGNDLSEETLSFLESCGRPYLGKPFMPTEITSLMNELERRK